MPPWSSGAPSHNLAPFTLKDMTIRRFASLLGLSRDTRLPDDSPLLPLTLAVWGLATCSSSASAAQGDRRAGKPFTPERQGPKQLSTVSMKQRRKGLSESVGSEMGTALVPTCYGLSPPSPPIHMLKPNPPLWLNPHGCNYKRAPGAFCHVRAQQQGAIFEAESKPS